MFDLLCNILKIIGFVLLVWFVKFYYQSHVKFESNKKLTHTDKYGTYWKFICYLNGNNFFIDISFKEKTTCYTNGISGLEYDRITVILKKVYANNDLNKIISLQNKNQINSKDYFISYDILKFHFTEIYKLGEKNIQKDRYVCFAGGVSYDFYDNPIKEIKGIESPSFSDFILIEDNSEMADIYSAVFDFRAI